MPSTSPLPTTITITNIRVSMPSYYRDEDSSGHGEEDETGRNFSVVQQRLERQYSRRIT